MAEPLDLASTIGTWFAAGLAIVALFGIVGPWFIWRDLRSERHLALATVDDKDHKFVSRGIRIKKKTYAFRKVNVSDLSQPPKLSIFVRKEGRVPGTPSRTGWAALLQAFDVFSLPQPRGGELFIKDRETWLQVHKLWLLVLGLLARFGTREDRAQAIARVNANSTRLDHEHLEDDNDELSGIVGVWNSITRAEGADMDQLFFTPYNQQLRGPLGKDHIPLATLFWLFAGCMPVLPGVVYDLCYKPTSGYFHTTLPGDETSVERYETPTEATEHMDNAMVGEDDTGRNSMPSLPASFSSNVRNTPEPLTFLRYVTVPSKDILTNSHWYAWAEAIGCDLKQVRLLEKHRPHPPPTEWNSTDQATTLWTSLGESQYIWRTDFHRICLGLLSIPMTHRHFLFNRQRGKFFQDILVRISSKRAALFKVVRRAHVDLSRRIEPTSSTAKNLEKLIELLKKTDLNFSSSSGRSSSSTGFSRTVSDHLVRVSDCVDNLQPAVRAFARQSVTLLYLSTPEFWSYIEDLLSKTNDANNDPIIFKNSYVMIDVPANTVTAYSADATGNTKDTHFRLAFHEVFPEVDMPTSTRKIKVPFESVILCCLQAWVKSTWMLQTIYSQPLIDFIKKLDDVVYVAARPDLGSVRRQGLGQGNAFILEAVQTAIRDEFDRRDSDQSTISDGVL